MKITNYEYKTEFFLKALKQMPLPYALALTDFHIDNSQESQSGQAIKKTVEILETGKLSNPEQLIHFLASEFHRIKLGRLKKNQ